MEVTIHIEPASEARLLDEATREGLTPDAWVSKVVHRHLPAARTPERQREIDEAIDRIRENAKHHSLRGLSIREMIDDGRKY